MDENPDGRAYAQLPTATNTLLGVRVIHLGAASGSLLPIAGALKDILLVGIAAELLGAVGDVDDRGDVGDQSGDRDRGSGAGSSVEWVTKMDSSWKYGNTWANMHQIASVKARFWIQPPLFQIKAATVGARSSAKPQNQEWVGRQL